MGPDRREHDRARMDDRRDPRQGRRDRRGDERERGARRRRIAAEHDILARRPTSLRLVGRDDIDAVYISTTNELHRDQVLAAAKAGKHVLCEKPLALTLADARAMVAACRARGVVMGTNHHLRNAATHRAMREAIIDGRDRQAAVRARLPRRLSAAASAGLAHRQARGRRRRRARHHRPRRRHVALRARRRAGRGHRHDPARRHGRDGVEDGVMGVVRFQSALLAQFHDAFTTRYAHDRLRGAGHRRLADRPRLHDASADRRRLCCATPRARRRCRSTTKISTSARCALFHDAVRGEGAPAATGEDGVRSMAMAIATLEAARSGRRDARRSDGLRSDGDSDESSPPTKPPASFPTARSSRSRPPRRSAVPTRCWRRSARASTRRAIRAI